MAGVNLGGGAGTVARRALDSYDGAIDRVNLLRSEKRRAELETQQNRGVTLETDRLQQERDREIALAKQMHDAQAAELAASTAKDNATVNEQPTSTAAKIAEDVGRAAEARPASEAAITASELETNQNQDTLRREKSTREIDDRAYDFERRANEQLQKLNLTDNTVSADIAKLEADGKMAEARAKRASLLGVSTTLSFLSGGDVKGDMEAMLGAEIGSIASVRQEGEKIIALDAEGNPMMQDLDGDTKPDPVEFDMAYFKSDAIKKGMPALYEELKLKLEASLKPNKDSDVKVNSKDIFEMQRKNFTGVLAQFQGQQIGSEAEMQGIREASALTERYMIEGGMPQNEAGLRAYVEVSTKGTLAQNDPASEIISEYNRYKAGVDNQNKGKETQDANYIQLKSLRDWAKDLESKPTE